MKRFARKRYAGEHSETSGRRAGSSARRRRVSNLAGAAISILALMLLAESFSPMTVAAAAGAGGTRGHSASDLTTTPAQQDAPGVYLYEHINYGGRWIHLTNSKWEVVSLGFNDITSSVRVVGDYRVTLYEHVNFTGARSTIRGQAWCNWIGGPKDPPRYGVWQGYGCYTEFSSPQEIGNDMVSSVAITTPDSYLLSSRLTWPSGMWISATVGAAVGWHFLLDGTYTFSYLDSSGISQVRGTFKLGKLSDYWGFGYYNVIGTYNNQVFNNGSYVRRAPDTTYRYYYKNSGNTISVLIEGKWYDYDFRAP